MMHAIEEFTGRIGMLSANQKMRERWGLETLRRLILLFLASKVGN